MPGRPATNIAGQHRAAGHAMQERRGHLVGRFGLLGDRDFQGAQREQAAEQDGNAQDRNATATSGNTCASPAVQ